MWRRRRPQSIYRHVLEHVEPGVPGLGEGGERLPDDETAFEGGIRWAPGALEGVISRYGAEPEEMEPRVSELHAALLRLEDRVGRARRGRLGERPRL